MIVLLWIDHAKIGCGSREFLVLKSGRKWVSLLALATLDRIKIKKAEFDAAKAKPLPYSKARLIRRIRTNALTYGASKAIVRDAITAANRK